MKKLTILFLVVVIALSGLTGIAIAETTEEPFSLWNPDASALKTLVEYVEAVTNPDSPDYIPEADRIATFDMDGTLMAELAPTYLEVMLLTERILADPAYEPDEEMLEFGRMTRDHALDKSFPDDYDYEFSYHQARSFAGMTLQEYADFITRFLVHEADGFEGMTYADAYYLPMVEVIDYLQDNGFKCYVVSGSDRFIVRTFIEGAFDIPAERIIGSDTALEARDQGDADGIEYVFTGEDELVRTDRLLIKDLKTNKVLQIAQEIGRQPVLSFGNSSGDVSMNNYALLNNRYRSAAFQLIADDGERDYGNPDKHDELTEKWQGMGYNVISMRDDWKTIYGEDVVKTGAFHWLENYSEERVPVGAEPEADRAMFSAWNPEAQALNELTDYLAAATDRSSPDYIPVEDRIALFDLDGTLMCETDPFCFEYMLFVDYALNHADEMPEEVLAVAREIVDAAGGAKPSGMSTRQAAAAAIAYKGMTMEELAEIVEDFKGSSAWGFTGLTRGEAWYKPMVQLVDVLQQNDFTVYIVTATERNIVRQIIAGALDIPPSQVIGTEYGYTATNQGDAEDTDYTFQSDDQIVFDGNYYGENAKTSKVDAIVREIGQQPVLAFGNSTGDLAMAVYTISNNPYKSMACMVLADDDAREWGDPESAAEKKASYEAMGIGTISMRDDFLTIYGDGVAKDPLACYQLEQVVVLSRHNLRAPLSSNGSVPSDLTPHTWINWSAGSSELTLKGGIEETNMGQYFRKWLDREELIPENYIPKEGEVRFNARDKQRCRATAKYFAAGMLPTADTVVEHPGDANGTEDFMQPVLHFYSDDYAADAKAQVAAMGGDAGFDGLAEQNRDVIKLIMDTVDMQDSEIYQSRKYGDLLADGFGYMMEADKEPDFTGAIKPAYQVADALILQYYEEPDAVKAAFGHILTNEDWVALGKFMTTCLEMKHGAPLVALSITNPLIRELKGELENADRKFTFFCAHDCTVLGTLSALGVEDFALPGSIETKTPIGVKVLFERWRDAEGQAWYRVDVVYRSTEQIRSGEMLTLDNPPMRYDLHFEDVETNADGLIAEEDLLALFGRTLNAYDALEEQYDAVIQAAA